MYIGKRGIGFLIGFTLLFGIGIALLLTPTRNDIFRSLSFGFVIVVAAVVVGLIVYYLSKLDKQLPPYWALKLFSILLKSLSVTLFLAGIGLTLYSILIRLNVSSLGSSGIGGSELFFIGIISPIGVFYWLVSCIIPYAFSHFIDAFLSIEASLKALATRNRPASLINPRSGQVAERSPELPQR